MTQYQLALTPPDLPKPYPIEDRINFVAGPTCIDCAHRVSVGENTYRDHCDLHGIHVAPAVRHCSGHAYRPGLEADALARLKELREVCS